jgi:hypothetical protein
MKKKIIKLNFINTLFIIFFIRLILKNKY